MASVAKRAGVATGTAYVHYSSKEEVVFATYLEIKSDLAEAVLEGYREEANPRERWHHVLVKCFEHLGAEPERARFLTQLEESPYYEEARARLAHAGDPLSLIAGESDLAGLFVDLPFEVIYSLSLGVVVRLVASGVALKPKELEQLVDSTWRAATQPDV